ncbi:MAG: hypothetical protein H7237_01640 [Alkalinema sp. FL-bin-369]|nr:hypothetical protein [Leptolyngbyaceae cyanobacterium LF-bin-369]
MAKPFPWKIVRHRVDRLSILLGAEGRFPFREALPTGLLWEERSSLPKDRNIVLLEN